jgi:hypothetical protein
MEEEMVGGAAGRGCGSLANIAGSRTREVIFGGAKVRYYTASTNTHVLPMIEQWYFFLRS